MLLGPVKGGNRQDSNFGASGMVRKLVLHRGFQNNSLPHFLLCLSPSPQPRPGLHLGDRPEALEQFTSLTLS